MGTGYEAEHLFYPIGIAGRFRLWGPIAEALHGVPGELFDTPRRRYLAEAPDIVDAIGAMYAGTVTA